MIAYIEGRLSHKEPAYVVIDIHGLGYEIKISLNTYIQIKNLEGCKLYTYLSIKEDAHTLYGFYEIEEKKVFLDLISISGVGPNTGLMILSSLNFSDVQQAVLREDVKTMQAIKGIGLKTAQRIILELKDKFKKDVLISQSQINTLTSHSAVRSDALSALLALGFTKPVAEKTLDTILKTHEGTITTEQLIKIALKTA